MRATTSIYTDGTYLERVSDWHALDAPWKVSKLMSMIEKHELSPRLVYDIGCGAGQILVELQRRMRRDIEFRGYDISPQGIDLCRRKENGSLRFFNEDFLLSDAEPCDLLLLLDVMEHVPDYIGFLEGLRTRSSLFLFHIPLEITVNAVLRKSSYMMNMRSEYGHLHYFTKETALATLSEAGYGIVDYCYTDDREMTPPPTHPKKRLVHEIRKRLYGMRPDLSVALFTSYNLLVLATCGP